MAKHKGPTDVALKSDTTKKLKQVVAKGKKGGVKISEKTAGTVNGKPCSVKP